MFEEIEKLEEGGRVTRFSVTGYSLGGLFGQYLVGYAFSLPRLHYFTIPYFLSSILHQRKFFATVTPVNFNTVITPHVELLYRFPGSVPSLALDFLVGPENNCTLLINSPRRGSPCWPSWQIQARTSSTTDAGLLNTLLDRAFLQGLQPFPHIRIYANAYVLFTIGDPPALTHPCLSVKDMTVPYMTAYVDLEDPCLNYTTNGPIVYVTVRTSSHISADSPFRDYDEKYFPIINLLPYRTHHHPNPNLFFPSHGSS